MDVLNFAEGHRVGRGHCCGVLQVCDQKGQLARIANSIQLLLLRVPSHVHQAMHQSLQLFHLATLRLRLLMPPHQPDTIGMKILACMLIVDLCTSASHPVSSTGRT